MRRFIPLLLMLLATRASAAAPLNIETDGLGFPVYPHSTSYSVFALNIAYLAGPDVSRILAWYRDRSGRRWTVANDDNSEGGIALTSTDSLGRHEIDLAPYQGGVWIREQLDLGMFRLAAARWRGMHLSGATDPLGLPLYPRRRSTDSVVIEDGGPQLVSYATDDRFADVEHWFDARLPNTFSKSYHVDYHGNRMQTFHGTHLTVSIVHREMDGGITVVSAARTH